MSVFCRLGVLACYMDPSDLGSYLQDSAVASALWQQLSQCISKGFVSAGGRVRGMGQLQVTVSSMFSWHVWLTLFHCVLWIAVFLVNTSSSDPECQQHGSSGAVCSQWSASPVGSFFSAVTPLRSTAGSPVTARITHIFPSTGQQGIISLVMLIFFLPKCHYKCINLSCISTKFLICQDNF